jgi:hypothetical protein
LPGFFLPDGLTTLRAEQLGHQISKRFKSLMNLNQVTGQKLPVVNLFFSMENYSLLMLVVFRMDRSARGQW